MKKYYVLFVCLLSTIISWAQGSSLSGTGAGTDSDPYRIYNVYHLAQLNNFQDQPGAVFELMNDIDVTEYIRDNNPVEGWDPVGVASAPFKGIIKGKNHTIRGLYINRSSSSFIGFFGYLDGAKISDLSIEGTSVKGSSNVGGFVGYAKNSTFTNCNITLKSTTAVSGSSKVGGFAGCISATEVYSCNSSGNVRGTLSPDSYTGGFVGNALSSCSVISSEVTSSVNGNAYTGGFAGSFSGKIDSATINGNIVGGDNTGGLVGSFSGRIDSATINGDIVGGDNTGGVVGYTASSIIDATVVNGSISSNGSNIGGVVGYASRVNVWSTTIKGNVGASNAINVGGIVGTMSENTTGAFNLTFEKISYTGDVKGKSNVSGGVGSLSGTLLVKFIAVHSRGLITNTGDNTGGIVGKSNGGCIEEMSDCSHFGDIKGNDYVGGLVGAVLNTTSAPDLHVYHVSSSSTSLNIMYGPYYDTIVNGTAVTQIINNCVAIGDITATNNVGGLIGRDESIASYTSTQIKRTGYTNRYLWKDGVYYCYTNNASYVNTYEYQRNTTNITLCNSYYSGNIYGNQNIGGIAGYKEGGEVSNCYTNSTIEGISSVGGVLGVASDASESNAHSRLTIKSNVAICSSISASSSDVGRIYGSKAGSQILIGALGSNETNRALTQCNVTLKGIAQTITANAQNGNSVGKAMLKLKANYVSWGWDFDDNWSILETESYPYKKYQAAPPYLDSKLVSQATTISGKSMNGGVVSMYYRDRAAVQYDCGVGHDFSFTTEPLLSGSQVQLFADVTDMVPSYFTTLKVSFPGSGTEDDPYLIYTAEDLHLMPSAGYFKIMNDIDLAPWIEANSSTTGWTPVGGDSSLGTYIDGNNCTISGLWMNGDATYSGLFAAFSSGYIKNLTVKVVSGKKVKGGDYTGILIGSMANGYIENCTVKGDAEGTKYLGGITGKATATNLKNNTADVNLLINAPAAYVGGLAGYGSNAPDQTVNNNISGSITSGGASSFVGGLFGWNNASVAKCQTNVTINVAPGGTGNYVGGLIGWNNASVAKCQANVTINVAANGTKSYVGGLIGEAKGTVSECYTTGEVKVLGADSYTGGIVGNATSEITDCYTSATITGTLYTAGITGYTTSKVNKCYASGNIYGQRWGAGLVGYLDGEDAALTNSMVVSHILSVNHEMAWACRVIGGFKNGAAEPDASNYALNTMQVSINEVPKTVIDNQVEGVAKTEAELKSAATYTALGWDMENIWKIEEGNSYPVLSDVESTPSLPGDDVDVPTDDEPSADISLMPNVVYINDIETTAGATIQIPISLKNKEEDIVGFQFEMYVPNGVNLLRNSRGKIQSPTFNAETERTSSEYHVASVAEIEGGIQVLCYSNANDVILGTDGVVFDFTATISDDMADGEYNIILKNLVITNSSLVQTKIDKVVSKLTIPSYTLGDVNADTEINVTDIAATASYILGSVPTTFVFKAADINSDEEINVTDIAGIANIILNGSTNTSAAKVRNFVDVDYESSLVVAPTVLAKDGNSAMMQLGINTTKENVITGFQCDVYLPEGISWASNNRGSLSAPTYNIVTDWNSVAAECENGGVRMLCYSVTNETIRGNEEGLLSIPIVVDPQIVTGEYDVILKDIVITDASMKQQKISSCKYKIHIADSNEAVSVDSIDCNGKNHVEIYDMVGRKYSSISGLPNGVYIINGKKVIKK